MRADDKSAFFTALGTGFLTALTFILNKELAIAEKQKVRSIEDSRIRYEDACDDDGAGGPGGVLPGGD